MTKRAPPSWPRLRGVSRVPRASARNPRRVVVVGDDDSADDEPLARSSRSARSSALVSGASGRAPASGRARSRDAARRSIATFVVARALPFRVAAASELTA
eukprot:31191-Pelagococcus_subviridis.AAC.11